MSRPREVREQQKSCPRRHPEMFDEIIDALDEAEHEKDGVDPYFGDVYHTCPGLTDFSGNAQPKMRKEK